MKISFLSHKDCSIYYIGMLIYYSDPWAVMLYNPFFSTLKAWKIKHLILRLLQKFFIGTYLLFAFFLYSG